MGSCGTPTWSHTRLVITLLRWFRLTLISKTRAKCLHLLLPLMLVFMMDMVVLKLLDLLISIFSHFYIVSFVEHFSVLCVFFCACVFLWWIYDGLISKFDLSPFILSVALLFCKTFLFIYILGKGEVTVPLWSIHGRKLLLNKIFSFLSLLVLIPEKIGLSLTQYNTIVCLRIHRESALWHHWVVFGNHKLQFLSLFLGKINGCKR